MELIKVNQDNLNLAIESAKLFYWNNKQKVINKDFFAKDENILIVALEDGKVIGSVYGYCLDRYDRENKQLFVYSIDVLEEHRKKGIGKKLINEFLKDFHNDNYHNAFVITNQDNIAAMNLYKSTGATRVVSGDGEEVLFVWIPSN